MNVVVMYGLHISKEPDLGVLVHLATVGMEEPANDDQFSAKDDDD